MSEWSLPELDLDRCTGCGRCMRYCPTQAVSLVEGKPRIVRPRDCAYCGLCEEICPVGAIQLVYEFVAAPAAHEPAKPDT